MSVSAQPIPEEAPEQARTLGLPEWDERARLDAETRTMTRDELLTGSAFHLSGGGKHPGGAKVTAWGRVASGGFDAEEDGVTLDGEVTTGLIGADARWDRLLAGVMVSRSRGKGSYRLGAELGSDEGKVESRLTGVYPYLEAKLSERISTWGLVGVGSGDLTLRRAGEVHETDLGMRMGALGVRGQVLDGSGASGVALGIRSDAMWVSTESDPTEGMMGAEGDVSRLRLILQGERPFAMEDGSLLTPSAELGVRLDGGDAETGAGLGLGAGLRYRIRRARSRPLARRARLRPPCVRTPTDRLRRVIHAPRGWVQAAQYIARIRLFCARRIRCCTTRLADRGRVSADCTRPGESPALPHRHQVEGYCEETTIVFITARRGPDRATETACWAYEG